MKKILMLILCLFNINNALSNNCSDYLPPVLNEEVDSLWGEVSKCFNGNKDWDKSILLLDSIEIVTEGTFDEYSWISTYIYKSYVYSVKVELELMNYNLGIFDSINGGVKGIPACEMYGLLADYNFLRGRYYLKKGNEDVALYFFFEVTKFYGKSDY